MIGTAVVYTHVGFSGCAARNVRLVYVHVNVSMATWLTVCKYILCAVCAVHFILKQLRLFDKPTVRRDMYQNNRKQAIFNPAKRCIFTASIAGK